MSTQDQITEILNAMDRHPELAEQLRARILGDDLMAEMGEAQNERVQIAELLGTVVELSGSLARLISAVDSRQRKSDDAIAGLQHEQEAVQSAIANMQADIERMATSQSRMDSAIAQLQTDVEALKSDVATLKLDMVYIKERLDQMDGRLDQMDGRLDQMDGRLDQMDGRLDQMDGRLDQMDGRLDNMDGRLDNMDGRLDNMDGNLNKMNGRIDNASGTYYEFKVQKNLGSIAGQHLRLRRVRKLKGLYTDDDQDLRDRVDEAEDNGIITESENNDMWLLDLIFSGRRRDDGKEVLVAAEVSITAGTDDISRAKKRAETLHKVTDTATIPVVIAEHIDQERQEAAEQAGVFIIPVPEN